MTMPAQGWSLPPATLDVTHDEVHVWRASLDQPAWCIRQLAQTLSADETRRAERFQFERDRRRFIATRGVLRILLGRYLHVEPRQLQFSYGAMGKPALAESHGAAALHFNLSHSHEWALYAIARSREIGIDLEYVRPVDDMEQVAARSFSAQENEALQALPDSLRLEAFYQCWTRKEAYVKATGNGLSQPLDRFAVSFVPGEVARFLHIGDDPQEAARWTLRELRPAAGYVAALAAPGNAWRLACWHWKGCGQEGNDRVSDF